MCDVDMVQPVKLSFRVDAFSNISLNMKWRTISLCLLKVILVLLQTVELLTLIYAFLNADIRTLNVH